MRSRRATTNKRRKRRKRIARLIPYGWRVDVLSPEMSPSGIPFVDKHGRPICNWLVEDPHEQDGINLMGECLYRGMRATEICRELEARGFPPKHGGRWTMVALQRILRANGLMEEHTVTRELKKRQQIIDKL